MSTYNEILVVMAYYILAIKSWWLCKIVGCAENQCLFILWDMELSGLYLRNCNVYIKSKVTLNSEVTIESSHIYAS
jgi:hypothetical protein